MLWRSNQGATKAYNPAHSTENDLNGLSILFICGLSYTSLIIRSEFIFYTLNLILKSIILKLMIIYIGLK